MKIIDGIIPRSLCLSAEAGWPSPDWSYWHRYNSKTANKFGSMDRFRIPPACLVALNALAIAAVPHIGNSFIDYDLHAAGLHMMPPGGFLARHLDAERHPLRSWRRTHSIVLCVNSTWKKEYGGQLLIQSDDDENQDEVIEVELGRAVVFDTPEKWHEVRQVSTCAGTPYRKTLALFAWEMVDTCEGETSAKFM
jgi:Rps23 Pro-64 3,4-dihydroxylase Tpa1-like proline 4-hydroxylase